MRFRVWDSELGFGGVRPDCEDWFQCFGPGFEVPGPVLDVLDASRFWLLAVLGFGFEVLG